MENSYHERSGFIGGVARVLNFGGRAMVSAYDVTSDALNKLFTAAKKSTFLPEKVAGMFTSGLGMSRPSETRRLEDKIEEYERKIKALYLEIGKEGANYSGDESALQTEPIKKLIADVREYEKEIQRLKDRIVEAREQKKAEAVRGKKLRKAAGLSKESDKAAADDRVNKNVESAIARALRHGEFETLSEREIFNKIANDLLDAEIDIKILAAAELGKIASVASVPILMEAVKFDNPELTSEIINSLISIGDARAIPVFKGNADHQDHRIRTGCLRGLYKMAENEEAIPVMTKALRDENPEVRRTAATFIGWKDYTDVVPSLVQCLRDEDSRVRKATVTALANIKDISAVLPLIKVLKDKELDIREKAFEAIKVISGEDITFDINASGKELTEAINNLRNWWQQERFNRVDVSESGVAAEVAESGAEAVEEAAASEESEFTEESLMRITKAELLSICEERGIEYNEKQTKAELTRLILGEK
ncbi:MAG TPA: HEAT repeat domain-containing protein [Anaerolineae bacterium]|nr:HEAT repeat domain-containing protein [Anaerolineae bacterium]